MSRAIVTPSFVIVGAPNFFSSTTLRPRGPRVILTVFAVALMPRSRLRRARSLKAIDFAMIYPPVASLLDDGQDVAFAEDQVLFAADLDLGPGILGEDDGVAHRHLQRHLLPAVQHLAGADGEDLALLRLLLRRIRQDDAALRGLFLLQGLDHHPVAEG